MFQIFISYFVVFVQAVVHNHHQPIFCVSRGTMCTGNVLRTVSFYCTKFRARCGGVETSVSYTMVYFTEPLDIISDSNT